MLSKVKKWLGIEGVKIEISEITEFKLNNDSLSGEIKVMTKSDQFIEGITISIIEEYSRGWRKSKITDKYDMGIKHVSVNREIRGETEIKIPFTIRYEAIKSPMDKLGEKNIFTKGMSGLAKTLKNAKSRYILLAVATVRGVALDPYVKIELREGVKSVITTSS